MSRHFPDFLTTYLEYSQDSFCPEKFHFWTGVSVLAGALERKVWIARESFSLYPNLYILLISRPGIGKSSAGNIGVMEFLRKLKSDFGEVNFIAAQNSEASFIEQCARWKKFFVGNQEFTHASSYFYASEASNSLKEMTGGGVITPALTEFYDCPPVWKKELKSQHTLIYNVCCNLLACCTFSHLKKLVPKDEAEGGFASRLLYIVQDEIMIRNPRWSSGGRSSETQLKLLEDLTQIHTLSGAFRPTKEFIDTYETWFPIQDAETQALKSERLQHFLARKHTNLLKLAMVCSVSESNDLNLEVRHWERAMALMKQVEDKLPKVIDHATDVEKQTGVNYTLMKIIQEAGGAMSRQDLFARLANKGINSQMVEPTLAFLGAGRLVITEISSAGSTRYKLLADPQDHL